MVESEVMEWRLVLGESKGQSRLTGRVLGEFADQALAIAFRGIAIAQLVFDPCSQIQQCFHFFICQVAYFGFAPDAGS